MKIAFFEFRISKEEKKALDRAYNRVIANGNFVIGEEQKKLEKEISEFMNAPYVLAVGNGYDALYILLKLVSDKSLNVLLQANAFPATLNAVLNAGHKAVFADIDFLNDGFKDLNEDFYSRNRIDLVLAIHYFGSANKIIKNLPDSIALMEDFSQAFGTTYKNKQLGNYGLAAAASLYPTKNLAAFGDAGIISTRDKSLYEKSKMYRNYGQSEYNNMHFSGVNSRMDEIQAAFLRENLSRIAHKLDEQRKIAEYYFEGLKAIPELILPESEQKESTFHQFTIKTEKRDELKKFLSKNGIETKIHYPNPLFDQKAYQKLDFSTIDQQNTRKWHDSILSLPSFPGIRPSEQDFIIEMINSFFA